MRTMKRLLLAVSLTACGSPDQAPPANARQEAPLDLEAAVVAQALRLFAFDADAAIIGCEDTTAGSACACLGVMSCMNPRWASACEPGTQRCSEISCTCAAA